MAVQVVFCAQQVTFECDMNGFQFALPGGSQSHFAPLVFRPGVFLALSAYRLVAEDATRLVLGVVAPTTSCVFVE